MRCQYLTQAVDVITATLSQPEFAHTDGQTLRRISVLQELTPSGWIYRPEVLHFLMRQKLIKNGN